MLNERRVPSIKEKEETEVELIVSSPPSIVQMLLVLAEVHLKWSELNKHTVEIVKPASSESRSVELEELPTIEYVVDCSASMLLKTRLSEGVTVMVLSTRICLLGDFRLERAAVNVLQGISVHPHPRSRDPSSLI